MFLWYKLLFWFEYRKIFSTTFLETNTIQGLQIDSVHECSDSIGKIVHQLGVWPWRPQLLWKTQKQSSKDHYEANLAHSSHEIFSSWNEPPISAKWVLPHNLRPWCGLVGDQKMKVDNPSICAKKERKKVRQPSYS